MYINVYTAYKNPDALTVEFVDLGQVGEDAGQLIRVQHRPHLLEKDLVQDPQGPQVGCLGGEQLWWWREREEQHQHQGADNVLIMVVEYLVVVPDSYRIWRPVGPPPSDWAWRGAEEEPCPASSGRRTPPPPAPRSLAAAPTVNLHSCRVTHTHIDTVRETCMWTDGGSMKTKGKTFFYAIITITKDFFLSCESN